MMRGCDWGEAGAAGAGQEASSFPCWMAERVTIELCLKFFALLPISEAAAEECCGSDMLRA